MPDRPPPAPVSSSNQSGKLVDSPVSSEFNTSTKYQHNASPDEESPSGLPANGLETVDEDEPVPGAASFRADPKVTVKVPPKRFATMRNTDPTCIPPITEHRKRTIVLCFDGTGDQFDADITNIAKIFSMLKKDDKQHQMCYYQAGIGTQLNRHVSMPGMKTFYKSLDSAVGSYLSTHVQEGYEFLMQNHIVGDKVCLFGFSRGAYTARALAGMLHKVGLLPSDNKQQIPYAWRMYKDTSKKGWDLSRQFKDNFCSDVNIEFIGVFDTVSSIGFLGRKLPFTGSNYGIRYFRHAMALDERRARFKVNHWSRVQEHKEQGSGKRAKMVRKGHEATWTEPDDIETDVKEVWFAGGHCDVGGGNVANNTEFVAANIPLRWMVREAFRCQTDILWDIAQLKRIAGLDVEMLYPQVVVPLPRSNSKLVDDLVKSGAACNADVNGNANGNANGNGNGNGHANQHHNHNHRHHKHGQWLIRHHDKFHSLSTGTILDEIFDDEDDSSSGSVNPKDAHLDGHEHVNGLRVYDDNDPELHDAYSKLFDQLSLSPIWWVLEFCPVKGRKHIHEDIWKEIYFVNMGRGRVVPKLSHGMYIHRSVKLRLKKGDYKTKAIYDQDPTWVL